MILLANQWRNEDQDDKSEFRFFLTRFSLIYVVAQGREAGIDV